MHINKSEMSMMDIVKFKNEAKESREYKDYLIETENYVLMKKELYEKLIVNQVQWMATDNKLLNRVDFSIEYRDLINEDEILRIIYEKLKNREE